jgi:hypothetical protein
LCCACCHLTCAGAQEAVIRNVALSSTINAASAAKVPCCLPAAQALRHWLTNGAQSQSDPDSDAYAKRCAPAALARVCLLMWLTKRGHASSLNVVYPFGCTLEVTRPAVPVLSSRAISFPANRPIGALVKASALHRCMLPGESC